MRHLDYDTTTVAKEPGPAINATLQVEIFEDKRRAHGPAVVFTEKANPVSIGGKEVCVNLESEYAGTIPSDVRAVIERHFRQRDVLAGGSPETRQQYVLQGSLKTLYVRFDAPTLQGVMLVLMVPTPVPQPMLFLAASGVSNVAFEQPAQVDIVFADLRLTRVRDAVTRALPDVRIHYAGALDETRACEVIYEHVDRQLRKAVEALAISVENELRAWSNAAP